MKNKIAKMTVSVGLASSFLLAGCQAQNTTNQTKTAETSKKDVAYATKSDTQKFDIYLPNTNGKAPVVLNIHGGGFMLGDKSGMSGSGGGMPSGSMPAMPSGEKPAKPTGEKPAMPSGGSGSNTEDPLKTAVVNRGYAFATMNYRLSGEAPFPAAINDVKAMVRYLKAHADELGIDANRIYVIGGSAGGNLAALAGTSGDLNYIGESENLGNENQDSKVAGVVDMFGPINFLTMDSDFKELGVANAPVTDSETSPESKYIGTQISKAADKVAAANPTTYLDANDPKMLVQAGSKDTNIPYIQGKKFVDAANAISPGKATWTLLEGEGHGTAGFTSEENLNRILNFLDSLSK